MFYVDNSTAVSTVSTDTYCGTLTDQDSEHALFIKEFLYQKVCPSRKLLQLEKK